MLPSRSCDPTTGKDLRRTNAKASLSSLSELQDPATSNSMLLSNQRLCWKKKKHDKHPDCEMAVEERERGRKAYVGLDL
jgi:hypothetical protein